MAHAVGAGELGSTSDPPLMVSPQADQMHGAADLGELPPAYSDISSAAAREQRVESPEAGARGLHSANSGGAHAISPEAAAQSQAGRIRHSAQTTGGNAGMMGGMAMGMFGGGGNMVGDMIAGQVVGNMVGQQVGRHQANAALASGAAGAVPLDPNSRQGKRAERRSKRYERRAERHEKVKRLFGGGKGSGNSSSSNSESDKD